MTTFGQTTPGGSATHITALEMLGTQFPLGVGMTVRAMYVYLLDNGPPTQIQCGIYDTSGNLLGTSNTTSTTVAGPSWILCRFATPVVLSAGTYFLCFINSGAAISYYYAASAHPAYDINTADTFPAIITYSGNGIGNNDVSIYATDTVTITQTVTTSMTSMDFLNFSYAFPEQDTTELLRPRFQSIPNFGNCVLALPMNEGSAYPIDQCGYLPKVPTQTRNWASWARQGKYGNCIQLQSSLKSYITCTDEPQLLLTNYMTFMAWIQPTSFDPVNGGNLPRIIDKSNDTAYAVYLVGSGINKVRFLMIVSSTQYTYDTPSAQPQLVDGKWHHLAVTWDGTVPHVIFYVDGVQNGAPVATHAGPIDTAAGNLLIGQRASLDRAFDGKICELYLYNTVLTASQIAQVAKGSRV